MGNVNVEGFRVEQYRTEHLSRRFGTWKTAMLGGWFSGKCITASEEFRSAA